MAPEELQKIQSLIDSLTTDEDMRQELWLLFLSGHSPASLPESIHRIAWEQRIAEQISIVAFQIMNYNHTLTGILNFLSPLERSIVILMAAGVSMDMISQYKGISHIRLRQLLFSIQKAPSWLLLAKASQHAEDEIEP